jgi:hypothetical protein
MDFLPLFMCGPYFCTFIVPLYPLGHVHLIILMFAPCPIHPIVQLFAPCSVHLSSLLCALRVCTSHPSMCAICPVHVIALMWATSLIQFILNCSTFSPPFYPVPPTS